MPIEVLPGRNGLQPGLALTYSSSTSHGLAGTGWGIPVSSIVRTGPGRGTATYGPDDRFFMSLNGSALELMPLGPTAIQGSDARRYFRTRIESWSNVIAHYLFQDTVQGHTTQSVLTDQVAYWEVWSKSGERYSFGPLPGEDASAYCVAYDVPPNNLGGNPRRNQWMLRLVEDVDDRERMDSLSHRSLRQLIQILQLRRKGISSSVGESRRRRLLWDWRSFPSPLTFASNST
jgi:hypothetical protein